MPKLEGKLHPKMKYLFLTACVIITANFAKAQTIPATAGAPAAKADSAKGITIRLCMPSKSELLNPPLYIIKSHNKEFKVKDISILNPNAIQAISVLKDSSAINKYGNEAKNGVVLITVNDDKYPELYKEIKKAYKERNKSSGPVNL